MLAQKARVVCASETEDARTTNADATKTRLSIEGSDFGACPKSEADGRGPWHRTRQLVSEARLDDAGPYGGNAFYVSNKAYGRAVVFVHLDGRT
jgi:hypothetical protein